MELNILEDNKNRIIFEIKGETHTFCNALKKELWNDKKVKLAAYDIDHPFVGVPKMIVETEGASSPKKVLVEAAKRLEKKSEDLKQAFVKAK